MERELPERKGIHLQDIYIRACGLVEMQIFRIILAKSSRQRITEDET